MEASDKGVQYILAIMKSGGTISGSDNRMYAIINNPELHIANTALENTISANTQKEGIILPLNFPLSNNLWILADSSDPLENGVQGNRG